MAVGGSQVSKVVADDDVPVKAPATRNPGDLEPVFFHSVVENLIAELLHSMSPKKPAAVMDLTPGEGTAAFYCLKERIPIVCFCHTSTHVEALRAWLTKLVFKSMM